MQNCSIGIPPSRHPPGLLSLPATAFTIRLWARFAYSAKASLFRRLLSFPTKLCFAGALNCYPLGLWLGRSIIVPICILFSTLKCSLNNRIFIITAVCFHFIVNSRTVGRYNLIALQTPGISILSLTIWKFLWHFVIFYAIIYDEQ